MKKALVLLLAAATYVWFAHIGNDVAQREISHVKNLYTAADTQALVISSSAR